MKIPWAQSGSSPWATTVMSAHRHLIIWEMLAGIFLVSTNGLALPDWAFCGRLRVHAKATEMKPLTRASTLDVPDGSPLRCLLMIVNAGAACPPFAGRQSKSSQHENGNPKRAGIAKRSPMKAPTDAILARGRVIHQNAVAGATNQSIREYIKAEAARDKAKAETLAPPHPSEQPATYADQVPALVRKYMAFCISPVPFYVWTDRPVCHHYRHRAPPGGVEFPALKAMTPRI